MKLLKHFVVLLCLTGSFTESYNFKTPSFGTKTAYANRIHSNAHNSTLRKTNLEADGLEVFYVDGIFRHGTRYPSGSKLGKWKYHFLDIQKVHPHAAITQALEAWERDFPTGHFYKLHSVGKEEMKKLADAIFTNLGPQLNIKDSIHYMTSPKTRAKQSACAFIEQILCLSNSSRDCKEKNFHDGNNTVLCSGVPVEVNTHLLRSFDQCPKYSQQVSENPSAKYESELFTKSEHMIRIAEDISQKLGYHLEWPELLSLYQYCAFKYALYGENDICNLFNDTQLMVLKYYSDLSHYYKTGHGYKINYELSCWLIQDILDKFNQAIQGMRPGGTFRFGHAETLIPLLSLLGFYNDSQPLTTRSFPQHQHGRLFRTGHFSPFGGNALFVLYRPKGTDANRDVKIAVVVNEHVVEVPRAGCHLCDFALVKRLLFDELAAMDCAAICKRDFPLPAQGKVGKSRDEL